jgi:hypothetical protein
VARTFAEQGHNYIFNWEREVTFTEAIPPEAIVEVFDRQTGLIISNRRYRPKDESPSAPTTAPPE